MSKNNFYYKEYKLDNGLQVYLDKRPALTVRAKLTVHQGSIHEKKGEEGLTHLLEHLLMTGGTKNETPKEQQTSRKQFGSQNAYTGNDQVLIPIGVLPRRTSKLLSFISSTMFEPTLNEQQFKEERQRVLEEINRARSEYVYADLKKHDIAFYGENSNIINDTYGKEEVIEKATINDLKRIHKRAFNPSNATLMMVGALPNNIEEEIEKEFGKYKRGKNTKIIFPKQKLLNKQTIIHTYAPDLINAKQILKSNAGIKMSFSGPIMTEKDTYAMEILNNILGGNSPSKLSSKISTKKGLTYNIGSDYNTADNAGKITIATSVNSQRVNETIDLIFSVMNELQTNTLSEEEITYVKDQTEFNMAVMLEENLGRIYEIGVKQDYGVDSDFFLKNIQKVTSEDVRNVARKYFPKDRKSGKYVLLIRDPLLSTT